MLKLPTRNPADQSTESILFAGDPSLGGPFLASGEEITAVISMTATPNDLILTGSMVTNDPLSGNANSIVTTFVSGGTPGTIYTIATTVQTNGDPSLEIGEQIQVFCREAQVLVANI